MAEPSEPVVYVLSLISVNHADCHRPEHRTVGVYSSKTAAASAAGTVDTELYGTFDSAIESMFEDDHVDNRENPPDHGCLLQIGSEDRGEGDYVKLMIETFTVKGDGKKSAARAKKKKASKGSIPHAAKRPKSDTKVVTREIDEAALMAIMKDIMKPAEYKRVNKKIQSLEEAMESEAEPLRSTRDHIFGHNVQPENLFEAHVGHFWGMFETRDYMNARLELANEIHDKIAVTHKTEVAWEAVLWHYQEMLRLCSSDNLGLRYRFPFLLLHLQRDDDAFCFIRYWIRDVNDKGYDAREKLHEASKEGDWLYGHEKDARLLDIFEACPDGDFEYVDLALLVALACIKMRIIAAHHGNSAQQRAQLDRIISLIHKSNPTMLPALIDFEPLLSQPAPDYTSRGSPSECHSIVEDACLIWHQIPGALKVLQDRFGKKPKYDCDMSIS